MDVEEVLEVLGNKYNPEILGATRRPKSVQELSDELGIPIATSYRRVDELTEIDLLELDGRELSEEGRRTNVYRRTVDKVRVEFDGEEVEISVEERSAVENNLVEVWTHLKED
jgi:predicted ArsR family transcriptional regulator